MIALICFSMLFTDAALGFPTIKSFVRGNFLYHCVYVCIAGTAQALAVHKYILIKTRKFSSAIFIVISCMFYVFGVSRQIDLTTVSAIVSILLNGVLMSLWTLQYKGISKNIGFYISCGILHYFAFGNNFSGNWISVGLTAILISVYVFNRKRLTIVNRST